MCVCVFVCVCAYMCVCMCVFVCTGMLGMVSNELLNLSRFTVLTLMHYYPTKCRESLGCGVVVGGGGNSQRNWA